MGASEAEVPMSILPDMGLPNTMSEAEYAALPEGIASQIEVVHGYVIVCESPTPHERRMPYRFLGGTGTRSRSAASTICPSNAAAASASSCCIDPDS